MSDVDGLRTLRVVIDQLRENHYADWPDMLERDVLPALRAVALAEAFQEMDAAMRIRHRLEPRCSALMPTDGHCDCGLAEARALAAGLVR